MLTIHNFISCLFFFFNDTATTEIYTLSLHDALPIYTCRTKSCSYNLPFFDDDKTMNLDRKSTRLNSSHTDISRMPSSACIKMKMNTRHVTLRMSASVGPPCFSHARAGGLHSRGGRP